MFKPVLTFLEKFETVFLSGSITTDLSARGIDAANVNLGKKKISQD